MATSMNFSAKADYRMSSFSGFDTFPTVKRIDTDTDKGTITISAKDCDQIRWITAPKSLDTIEDYKTSLKPWQLGEVIHIGKTLNYKKTKGIKNYVRAELHRNNGKQRTFTNPFGFSTV